MKEDPPDCCRHWRPPHSEAVILSDVVDVMGCGRTAPSHVGVSVVFKQILHHPHTFSPNELMRDAANWAKGSNGRQMVTHCSMGVQFIRKQLQPIWHSTDEHTRPTPALRESSCRQAKERP